MPRQGEPPQLSQIHLPVGWLDTIPNVPLSGPVTAVIIDKLSEAGHSEVGQKLREADLAKHDPGNVDGLNRVNRVTRTLDTALLKDPLGEEKVLKLIDLMIEPDSWPSRDQGWLARLDKALQADGYSIAETRAPAKSNIWPPQPDIEVVTLREVVLRGDGGAPFAERTSELRARLLQLGFSTAEHHLGEASTHLRNSKWTSANSQIRPALEALLLEIASRDGLTIPNPPGGGSAIAAFANADLIDANGRKFLDGVWSQLHSKGSHPGAGGESDTKNRMHLLTGTLGWVLDSLTP
ncbi:hypothetical protein GCM10025881_22560 [Pseudolysinimonas kribbensis]|uniref:AbiTii domain-containing protein n=1 Tax=Pseudolysinimonas kribbensis TaxID=433641 RepID=A0ABQ6K9B8_9MICO|nr:hypothetical protein GCM10025881_22560 [Pseudolysinimonas kribbensis]